MSYIETQDFRTLPLSQMRALVARFDERVNAAQLASPPTKELVSKAVHRQGAERCPVRIKRLSTDVIIRYGDRLADLFCRFPDDLIVVQAYEFCIGFQPPDRKDPVDPIQALMQGGEWTDEWGTRWGHGFGGVGATPVDWPIKDWSQLDSYLAHRMPDPWAPGRLDGAQHILQMHGETKYCVAQTHLALFERLHCLRGMENALADFYTNEREVSRLLDALTEFLIELIRNWSQTSVSAIFPTDDWGSQTSLLVSPEMWRKYFRSRYRKVFDEIHRCGKDVFFHSCGNVTAIVPELIDLGVDVLDPLQPAAMDLGALAKQFGGRVAFCGGVDDQRLEDYTPPEVKDAVHQAIETLGRPFGNSYVVAPANAIVPSVPFENLEALIQASHEQ
jgi:uroporphyrinogen decarboxylase